MSSKYVPQKQDIIWLDFDPAVGREIQKRRPALVISNDNYNKQTGLIAVCPITRGQIKLRKQNLLIDIVSDKVDGAVNPLQVYTFDYKARKATKITELDDESFIEVMQLVRYIF
ncbi:type II toxin-antitoxin system PemK/MazF family toxin [Streptococcus oricebi]|uniref:Cell division protein n=1 Tax=Streptococcus oricebi TaxID=1547447 RepID=A0ABS5B1D2_9STRE|nr:cell division protein [Streptococcus oricebi]